MDMTLSDWIAVVSVVFAFVSALSALQSSRRAEAAEGRSIVEAQTRTYLDLRERFQAIKEKLSSEWDSEHWRPEHDSDEWRTIELYWQNAFDEWFVTTKLNQKYLGQVWSLFFEDAVRKALGVPSLRYVAWRLTEEDKEFGKYRAEFRRVLDALFGEPGIGKGFYA